MACLRDRHVGRQGLYPAIAWLDTSKCCLGCAGAAARPTEYRRMAPPNREGLSVVCRIPKDALTMPNLTNRRIVLASRPSGAPRLSDFRLEQSPVPELGDGEVLLRTLWLSLDPYMRGR